ncbi:guanylate kinase [Dellaglioa algida]|uniref:Guanylate kinase n=1 Tax=Dellaglioa algida TaxID=105612 RepID=A0A5C6MD57_9LACO|nr:AAA family ATPase [Dellaglioa algida]MDK1715975.1 AAA family ATPase [Dellaglioa algida]MDK1719256.1 AAA family ATPase [Dellaglioa algida]MDK1721242.1 AAA family ATPase [Dellaglioa algida]MDK1722599.1 AAA family ATPase [Dellaglioa algida]MDK1724218.1 AAA family ATPase [Dellaglioa algida]
MQKRIFVITGAPGTGKTTIRDYLTEHFNAKKVITHTTRQPRDNEKNGRDYYFESNETFFNFHYLEHVEYDRHYYGSSREAIDVAWSDSENATIVLDTAGAITYSTELPKETVILYLCVSDTRILKDRLTKRGDTAKNRSLRLDSGEAKRDMELPTDLEGIAHIIINDDLNDAKKQINVLIASLDKG